MRKYIIICLAVLSALIVLAACSKTKEISGPLPTEDFVIIAHRGASGYAPENTMASFALANEMNADYIELDIHLTLDGEIVVLHDKDVMATTDSIGDVSSFTLEQLKELTADFRSEEGKRPVEGPQEIYEVPTLQEVFDQFGKDVHFIIELKDTKNYIDIEKKLVKLLEDNDRIQDDKEGNPITLIHSFDTPALKKVHELNKDIPLVQIISFITDDETDTAQLSDLEVKDLLEYADGIDVNYEALTKEFVRKMQKKELPVYAYTVNDAVSVAKMKKIGVNGIHTNYPDLKNME